MSECLSFFVPGEPRGAGRPRFIRATGHAIDPPAAVSYKAMIREHAQAVMGDRPVMLTGPLKLTLVGYWLKPVSWSKAKRDAAVWHTSTPDWDNIGKIVCDALNGIAYADDAAIACATVTKAYGPAYGIWIQLEQLT